MAVSWLHIDKITLLLGHPSTGEMAKYSQDETNHSR